MNLPDLVLVALVQGVADVLPIDGSAHSLLVSRLVGWRAGTIMVAIHLGAALALLAYLWRDAGLIATGLWKLRKGRIEPGLRLLGKALLASAPCILAVSAVGSVPVANVSDLLVVGMTTIICALAMAAADQMCMTVNRVEHAGGITAVVIGLAQLLAFFPGVGRTAAALTTARLLGLERPAGYRFVLLANVPVLFAAAGSEGMQNLLKGLRPASSDMLAFAITFVLVLSGTCLAMSWIRRMGLWPFAVYRLGLGITLVAFSFY